MSEAKRYDTITTIDEQRFLSPFHSWSLMMNTTAIDSLTAFESDAREKYYDLVFALIEHRHISAAEIRSTIFDVGKTPDELKRDVAAAQRRLELSENLKRADVLSRQIVAVDRKKATLLSALEAIRKENAERELKAYAPYLAAINESNDLRNNETYLRSGGPELFRTSDPAISRATARIQDDINFERGVILAASVVIAGAAEFTDEIAELEREIEQFRRIKASADCENPSAIDSRIDGKVARVVKLRQRVAFAESKKAEVEAAQKRIVDLSQAMEETQALHADWKSISFFPDDDRIDASAPISHEASEGNESTIAQELAELKAGS